MFVCACNAAVAFLFTLFVLLFRRPLAWNEVMAAVGLQTVVTLVLAVIIRRGQVRRRALKSAGLTVREATRIGLDNVNSQIRDLGIMLLFVAIIVPLLALSVSQLISSGKMNGRAALSFALVCALILTVNAAIQWWKYRRTLVPRRERLEQILATLQEEKS
jgi:prepilin signal peptidase PulO-like enzyme (type II secretory pathway)